MSREDKEWLIQIIKYTNPDHYTHAVKPLKLQQEIEERE